MNFYKINKYISIFYGKNFSFIFVQPAKLDHKRSFHPINLSSPKLNPLNTTPCSARDKKSPDTRAGLDRKKSFQRDFI